MGVGQEGVGQDLGAGERRFFLAVPPPPEASRVAAGTPAPAPRLTPEDVRHALRVLRVEVGDELGGLDGRGGAWRLRVETAGSKTLDLSVVPGSERREPAPGAPGALARIEIASAIPKGPRLEDMWSRLVALGVARWWPLVCERSAPGARELSAHRLERLGRIAAETCKQSGRTWLPELAQPTDLCELAAAEPRAELAFADPPSPLARAAAPQGSATRTAHGWAAEALARGAGAADRPLLLCIGPEGGFSAAESELLRSAGAAPIVLGPHVLRIELAAEAAAAALIQAAWRAGPIGAAGPPRES